MLPTRLLATDLLLLGAGPAHLEVLRRFAHRPQPGLRLTLVTPEPYAPSAGLLPGLIRGDAALSDACVDLGLLCVAAGARLILAEPVELDLARRVLDLARHPPVPFDLLSIDLDGESAMPDTGDSCIPACPAARFLAQLPALQAALPDDARIAIMAGGIAGAALGDTAVPDQQGTARRDAAGIELALALARRFRDRWRLVLVTEAAEPLAAAPLPARRAVRAALVDAGVELASGVRAGPLSGGRLALSDGSFLPADAALWAGDRLPANLLADAGLACDGTGRVLVDAGQRSISHPAVFAAGDCAAPPLLHSPGPLLTANLRRAARGRRLVRGLRRWLPPQLALAMLDLGGGHAVAWRHRVAVAGATVGRCKTWLDRRWLRAHTPQVMPPHHAQAPPAASTPVSRHEASGTLLSGKVPTR
jgi:selenide, water dikinase